ncbi:hypothetical protein B7939_00610 [Eggerthia catenaformis]|nr:hypothetical protein B7939_00610 [Eggerthia catenaformis]
MKEKEEKKIKIRSLTPRECGRLMGVSKKDIDTIIEINSDTQAYKQFGNSIVVDVLYYALKPFFENEIKENVQ